MTMRTTFFQYFLTLQWVLTSAVFAQNLAPKTTSTPPHRAPGQKFIDEVWQEFHTRTFQAPTFDELATTHDGATFEELWEIARRNNPSIRQKANLVSAAMGGRVQAGLYPNPTISYTGDNLGVDDKAGKHGMGISQPVVTAGKKKLDRAVASYDVDIARREYSMECTRVYNDLRIAHCELIHAQLTVKIEAFSQKMSEELLNSALTLEKEGKSRPIDVLKFKTSVHESAMQFRQAQNNLAAAWRRVAAVLGIENMPYRDVRGTLLVDQRARNWDAVWATFRQSSPQLGVAQTKVAQARLFLARQEAEKAADFSATFVLSRDVTAEKTVPLAGISMPLKLYDRNQGNIRKAKAELAASQRDAQRITLGLQRQLASVYRDYENARELLDSYEASILPDTFQALRLIDDAYKKGEMSYLELYTQRQSAMITLLRYVDALKQQAVAATLIDGLMLQGSLE